MIRFIVFLLLAPFTIVGQSINEVWNVQGDSPIIGAPVLHDNVIFYGNVEGVFNAVDAHTGQLVWSYDTDGVIQSQAIIADGLVVVESANIVYAFTTKKGKLKWSFNFGIEPASYQIEESRTLYKIDPWDEIRSSFAYNAGKLYIGNSAGEVVVLNTKGVELRRIKSDGGSAIRTTPLIRNERLYFGDWNGLVYCYNLESNELVWKKNTYRGEPWYPSFGGVVSEFQIHNDLLYFGARNPMLNVLSIDTGDKEWTYSAPNGGWIVGHPVIDNDTLFIGGSDSFKMYAFNANWGALLWEYDCGQNIYTRPIVRDDMVIFTSGNGYAVGLPGMLNVVSRRTGNSIAELKLTTGSFASPLWLGSNQVVVGTHGGQLIKVEIGNL